MLPDTTASISRGLMQMIADVPENHICSWMITENYSHHFQKWCSQYILLVLLKQSVLVGSVHLVVRTWLEEIFSSVY